MSRFVFFIGSLFFTSMLASASTAYAQTQPTNLFAPQKNTQEHFSPHVCQAPSADERTTLSWTDGGLRPLPHHHWQRCTYSSPLNAMVWEDVSKDDAEPDGSDETSKHGKKSHNKHDNSGHDGMRDFTDVFKNGVGDKFRSIGGKKN